MSKLTKEEFHSLYSDDITKKEYDRIISKINTRFQEICNDILKPYVWYDFDNCSSAWLESESGDGGEGFFDPERYKQTIYVTGEGKKSILESVYGNEKCPNTEFPTRWLYEDYWDELKQRIDLFKISYFEDIKNKKAKSKEYREKQKRIKLSIEEKLSKLQDVFTKEELKLIEKVTK